MFDDLRKSASEESGFPDDLDGELEPLLKNPAEGDKRGFKLGKINTFGLTAFQRFILSGLLFLLVLILGFMLVLITSSTLSA